MLFVYKITNTLNNKVYIGKSKNPKRAFQIIANHAKNNVCKQRLQEAIIKDRIDNFTLEIIAISDHKMEAKVLVQNLIEEMKSDDINFGYNKTNSGRFSKNHIPFNKDQKLTEKHRQSLMTPKTVIHTNEDNHLTGKHWTLVDGKRTWSERSDDYYNFENKKIYGIVNECFKNGYNDGDLTIQEYYNLATRPCYWCGACPNQVRKNKHDQNITWVKNGLDRKDNFRPHDKDNVVPACWCCNNAKGKLSHDEFLAKIREIYNNMANR